jgi:hypothetical protein
MTMLLGPVKKKDSSGQKSDRPREAPAPAEATAQA